VELQRKGVIDHFFGVDAVSPEEAIVRYKGVISLSNEFRCIDITGLQ